MNSKKYICHVNLAKAGDCKYWSRCKYEHINLPYIWRTLKSISSQLDLKNSIANRLLPGDISESIEISYSNPSNKFIQLEIFGWMCKIDFENMTLSQEKLNVSYNLERISTRPYYKKEGESDEYDRYLTKWNWYYLETDNTNQIYTLFDKKVDELGQIDSAKLEQTYQYCLSNNRSIFLFANFGVNFKKMRLFNKDKTMNVEMCRRPQFRALKECRRNQPSNLEADTSKHAEEKSSSFICHLNLFGPENCNFGASCKYEHTHMIYVWKILAIDKEKSESKRNSIANRTLCNRDCETIEKAYCDANATIPFKIKLNDTNCDIDFKNMTITQYLDSNKRNYYEIRRVSTISACYDRITVGYEFLTKWIWYSKKSVDNTYNKLDDEETDILENGYVSFSRGESRKKCILKGKEVNFEKMTMIEKTSNSNINYILLRRPQYRSLDLSQISSNKTENSGIGKLNICYINLSKIGKCLYGDKCINEHLNRKYVWRIRDQISLNKSDPVVEENRFISNRILPDTDCQLIETAYCDSMKLDLKFNIRLLDFDCEIDFERMEIKQITSNFEVNTYKLERQSTKSNFDKTSNFPFIKYLTNWSWYFNDHVSSNYTSFDKSCRFKIDSIGLERLYDEFLHEKSRNKTSYCWLNFEINMSQMILRDNDTKEWFKVVRRPVFEKYDDEESQIEKEIEIESNKSVCLPSNWTQIHSNNEIELVDLKTHDSSLFRKLKSNFLKSIGFGDDCYVVSIERIQNQDLYFHFKANEIRMSRKTNSISKFDLYHGTREENVMGIIRSNFDWRLAGRNTEALYGDGVYFSSSANYSNEFAVASETTKIRHMFIASVLVGSFVKGTRGLKRPPLKRLDEKSGEVYYDSCVDDVQNPKIYVIFDFNNIYPSFLIKYKLKTD